MTEEYFVIQFRARRRTEYGWLDFGTRDTRQEAEELRDKLAQEDPDREWRAAHVLKTTNLTVLP